jgi:hypothetical protein
MGEMKPYYYFMRPDNMGAYRNLCSDAPLPPGITSLLGLGLKFCIESPRPDHGIDKLIQCFQRSVQLHFHFSTQEERNDDTDAASTGTDPEAMVMYIPPLYIPSTPAKFDHVEFSFGKFDERINAMKRALPTHK